MLPTDPLEMLYLAANSRCKTVPVAYSARNAKTCSAVNVVCLERSPLVVRPLVAASLMLSICSPTNIWEGLTQVGLSQ